MNKVWSFIVKQYDIGIWFGALKDMFSRAGFYISLSSFVMLIRTTYNTGAYADWLTFWRFAAFFVFIIFLAMVWEFKAGLPSAVQWQNRMRGKHKSPELEAIKALTEKVEGIEDYLGIKKAK